MDTKKLSTDNLNAISDCMRGLQELQKEEHAKMRAELVIDARSLLTKHGFDIDAQLKVVLADKSRMLLTSTDLVCEKLGLRKNQIEVSDDNVVILPISAYDVAIIATTILMLIVMSRNSLTKRLVTPLVRRLANYNPRLFSFFTKEFDIRVFGINFTGSFTDIVEYIVMANLFEMALTHSLGSPSESGANIIARTLFTLFILRRFSIYESSPLASLKVASKAMSIFLVSGYAHGEVIKSAADRLGYPSLPNLFLMLYRISISSEEYGDFVYGLRRLIHTVALAIANQTERQQE